MPFDHGVNPQLDLADLDVDAILNGVLHDGGVGAEPWMMVGEMGEQPRHGGIENGVAGGGEHQERQQQEAPDVLAGLWVASTASTTDKRTATSQYSPLLVARCR